MAKKRVTPRPTGPSAEITRLSRPFGNSDEGPPDDATAPGDGKARVPSPVALDDVDLDRLADEFSAEIDHQRSAQAPFFEDLLNWSNLYRGKPQQETKNYPFDHASNVVVKLAQIYSNQVIARIYQGIVNQKPAWMVTELNKKFAPVCKPYQRYLDWNQQNMWNQKKFLLPYVQDCVKLGTSIGYNDFVDEPVIRYNDQSRTTEIVGRRKGPRPTWVPREDFLMPIGYSELQRTPWFSHRVWLSWDLLEQLSYRGFIQDLDSLKGHGDEEDDLRMERRTHEQQVVVKQPDDRFGLWAPEWVWFRRDLDRDGWPEEYVMFLHPKTKTILRLVANPSPSGTRPYFKSAFISVQGEFDGIGIPEAVEDLQEEASTIHNQRRDRSHLGNIVMWIAKMATQLPDSIRPRSGLVIKTPGGSDDIREFSPSIGQVPIDMAEEGSVMSLAAQTVGLNDVDLNKMSSPMGRAAATTTMAMMQEGSKRFDLNVTQIVDALTEEAHQITELWQVYGLPGPEESGSPEQVLDTDPGPNGGPSDAQLVRALIEQPASLRGVLNIKLNASTASINQEVEKQGLVQLVGLGQQYLQQTLQMSALVGNPQMPPEMKAIVVHMVQGIDKIMAKLYQSYDAFDLESTLSAGLVEQLFQKSLQMPGVPMGVPPQAEEQAFGGGGGGAPAKPANGSAQ